MENMEIRTFGNYNNLIHWKDFDGALPVGALEKARYSERYKVLMEPVTIQIGLGHAFITFNFNKGYLFDFASIPNSFEWFINHDSKWLQIAAYCHDNIFHNKGMSADLAGDLFYDILRHSIKRSGFSWIKRMRLRFRARVMKVAVKSLLAERMMADSSEIDIYNRVRSSYV